MNKDFDFFLLLSALAIFLVLWLIVKTVKGQSKGTSQRDNSAEIANRRTERVRARKNQSAPPNSQPQEPRAIRPMSFVFSTPDGLPFAALTITSIGAQPWGEGKTLSERLNRFIEKFAKTEDHERALIHIVRAADSKLDLSVLAYDEKGSAMGKSMPSGLKVEDFPVFAQFGHKDLRAWSDCVLAAAYRCAFNQAQPHEMAYLIKCEREGEPIRNQSFLTPKGRLALLHLGLIKISNETDSRARWLLLNNYMQVAITLPTQDFENISSLQRLIFSQTFAQTQKLPFLLVCTPNCSGKCYNALNY